MSDEHKTNGKITPKPQTANGKPAPTAKKAPAPQPTVDPIVIRRASDIPEERIEWLWRSHFAMGKISLIDGDPDTNKSAFVYWLAAIATQLGRTDYPFGGSSVTTPIDVLMFVPEEGAGDSVVPRLRVAGADLNRVHICDEVTPTLPGGVKRIEKELEKTGARLLVLDPLHAFLDGGANPNSDSGIRAALMPLGRLLKRRRVAGIIVRHLNKGESEKGRAMYRGSGSIGIIGTARASFLMARDPSGADDLRVLAPIKTNLCKKPPSLSFQVESVGEIPKLKIIGESQHQADALVLPPQTINWSAVPDERIEPRALADAVAFLREELKDGSFKLSKAIEEKGEGRGIKKRSLERARKELGVIGVQINRKWHMTLQPDPTEPLTPPSEPPVSPPEGSPPEANEAPAEVPS